jgi:hypothetical protein
MRQCKTSIWLPRAELFSFNSPAYCFGLLANRYPALSMPEVKHDVFAGSLRSFSSNDMSLFSHNPVCSDLAAIAPPISGLQFVIDGAVSLPL